MRQPHQKTVDLSGTVIEILQDSGRTSLIVTFDSATLELSAGTPFEVHLGDRVSIPAVVFANRIRPHLDPSDRVVLPT